MRFRPQSVDELDPNIRWGIKMRLRLIEEVVTGPHVSVTVMIKAIVWSTAVSAFPSASLPSVTSSVNA